MSTHATHPEIIKRLKRAEGHLRRIIGMLEEERPCVEVAQQLQAVEAAVANAKKTLVHDHIDHCLDDAIRAGTRSADEALREFKSISKYL
ncbi:metal-sensing transcriptional repressor [Cupriavidus necator]